MTETVAHEYSSDSTQREQSNEYQHDRVNLDGFLKSLCPCALDAISLSRQNEGLELESNLSQGPPVCKDQSQNIFGKTHSS